MLQLRQQFIHKFGTQQSGGRKGQGNTEPLTGNRRRCMLEKFVKNPAVKRMIKRGVNESGTENMLFDNITVLCSQAPVRVLR